MSDAFDPSAGASDVPDTTDSGLFGIPQSYYGAPVALVPRTPGPDIPGAHGKLTPEDRAALGTPGVVDTVLGAAQSFYGFDPQSLATIQQQLYAGHFYDDGYYTKNGKVPQFGVPDEDSYSAFRKAVLRAARSQRPLSEVLAQGMESGAQQGGGRVRIPHLTDPNAIRDIARKTAQALLGRNPTDAEMTKAIGFVQGNERANATEYDASGNPVSVTDTNPSSDVDAFLRQQAPGEVQAHDIGLAEQQFLAIVNRFSGGGAGGV